MKRIILEMGTGNDLYGEDYAKLHAVPLMMLFITVR